ncbi:hypothetical protein [Lichenicoccus sp.]|uniref:hypothetical protein n=1 Tax=Lichenicoccus sp. TaxID=2781899 RepID=UPI003D14D537
MSWILLAGCYLLFAEQTGAGDLAAGAVIALCGSAIMEAARRHSDRRYAVRPSWARVIVRQIPVFFAECLPLLRAFGEPLGARERGLGRLVAIPFDGTTGRTAPQAAGRRALVTSAVCFTPNSVVLGLEMQPGHLLLHQIEATAEPPGGGNPVWPI